MHQEAKDEVGPRDRWREAERLAAYPFDPRAPRQRLPLDLRRVPLARAGHLSVQRPRGRAPIIGSKPGEPAGLPPCFALPQDGRCAASTDLRADPTRVMRQRMPQPAWGAFVAAPRPPRSSLSASSPARALGTARASGVWGRRNAVWTASRAAAFFLSSLEFIPIKASIARV